MIKDTKSGKINNVDPVPIAIMHAAMIIWVEVLKNKYNLKNEKLLSKNLLIYLKNVFNADLFVIFECIAKISLV